MLDHVTLPVSDLSRSIGFYTAALGAIGIAPLYDEAGCYVGYGQNGKAFFWIGVSDRAIIGVHVAFAVPGRGDVDRFHRAALAAGGHDNGAPGLRPHYHANYYGAFVLDPDGHNIEAVCRRGPDVVRPLT